jgi:DNA polymerase-3 subunit alpha
MGALFQLQKDASAAGMKPIFGYSFDCSEGFSGKIYVKNHTGLRNLLRVQKAIMVDSPDKTISFQELLQRGEGNYFVFDVLSAQYMVDNIEKLYLLAEAYEGVYYQVDPSEYKAERIDIQILNSLKLYFDKLYSLKLTFATPILISDCYYLDLDDAKNKIILNKIAEGAAHRQSDQQYFKDIDELYNSFATLFSDSYDVDAIFEECCYNTTVIANGANASFETTRNYMPKYDLTEEEKVKYGTAHNMFCQLLDEGLNRLVPEDKREQYRKQMEYEKYVIEATDNVDYLLVQYDTVNWCRRNNILVGCGRGSAAGSLLLYLLGITLVDPIKYNLIFERFLLPERAGLYPAQTTKFESQQETLTQYVEVTMENGKTLYLDKDSKVLIKGDNDEPTEIYADELIDGDDIIIDNRDQLFILNQ